MRTASVSLVVIGLALAAIVAGFLSGQVSSHPPAIVTLHPSALPSSVPVSARNIAAEMRRVSDAAVDDAFSDDDVVVERPAEKRDAWAMPRLSFVVGLAGDSSIVDAQFLRAGVPLAFDLDPDAHDAVDVARLVRASGDALFVHVDSPPAAASLDALRARIGSFDGIASHADAGMARALAGTGLAFFDEAGEAAPQPFARARVRLVQRDATVDDRTSQSYIDYMLEQAALRARTQGRLVVFMRPQPNSLAALNAFLGASTAEIAALR